MRRRADGVYYNNVGSVNGKRGKRKAANAAPGGECRITGAIQVLGVPSASTTEARDRGCLLIPFFLQPS